MYQDILENFREDTLPDLDTVVLAALEYFEKEKPTQSIPAKDQRILVLGSQGAATVGKLLYADSDAVFANESTYKDALRVHGISAVVVVSASGGKHAPEMVAYAKKKGVETFLITATKGSPAGKLLDSDHVTVFPKLREPYTYNVSTYLGMLLAKTGENAGKIKAHIERVVPGMPNTFSSFDAFFLIIPPEFEELRGLLIAKFDELFGPRVTARVYTTEQAKHAKTVISSPTECFISFGERNKVFGTSETRIHIPLSEYGEVAGLMATAYVVIGHIQKQLPPYFKDNIEAYAKHASKMFNTEITPIVS